MIGPGEFFRRLEAAAEAFLTPAEAEPVRRKQVGGSMPCAPIQEFTDEERHRLQEQALALNDPDVRGYLVVIVREYQGGADIDVDWCMPEGVWPGVGAAMMEAVPS